MAGINAVRALVVNDEPSLIGEFRLALCAGNAVPPESDGLFSTPDKDLFGAAVNHQQFPAVELVAFRVGSDAVAAVRDSRQTDQPFSIAFIDMQLNSDLDGIETAERIRASDAQIQIAIVEGQSTLHPVELVTRIPPADRLSIVRRPFHPFEVQHLLLGCLHRRQAEARDSPLRNDGDRDSDRSVLRAVLDRLPVGVLVFDRHDQLVVANAEIGRLFADSVDLFVPGGRYDEIFRKINPVGTVERGGFGDQNVWRLRGPRWLMAMEEVAPTGETYCLFCDVTDLKTRDAAYWQSMHSTHSTRMFSRLCDTVEKLLAGDRKAADSSDKLMLRLRAVAQQQRLTPRVVDMSQYLTRAVRRIRRRLPAGVGLEAVLDANLWSVKVDSDGLGRVLAELTANACEAMPGGGRIIFEATNVRLAAESSVIRPGLEAGDYVRLSVQDTGRGMPQDLADRLPFPFQSASESEHSGLGLTIVHAFAIESGGWLDTSGGAGSGAIINLHLPKAAPAEVSEGLAASAGSKQSEAEAKPVERAGHKIPTRRARRDPPVPMDPEGSA